MKSVNFSKNLGKALSTVFASVLVCFACSAFVACTPKDLKYDDAIAIAKKDFGCEKILWITDSAALAYDIPQIAPGGVHYLFYIVGIKEGREVYIVVPSPPGSLKPYSAIWALDYSFSQIVEKFNENGANYVADVPDDYYSAGHDSYIRLRSLNGSADNNLGEDYDAFYARLDVKSVFSYSWEEDGIIYDCTVTQENGELKAYKTSRSA